MCVFCVQYIANAQEPQQNPFTHVEWRIVSRRYDRNIQTKKQEIKRIDADLRVQRSALQGELCPKGNRS